MNNFLNKHLYKIFSIFIWTIFLSPLLAPILLHFGIEAPAKFIYFIYSYTCHQLAHRSLHIFDYQCAWCTRDTFTWGAMAMLTILVPRLKIKPIKWYWVPVFLAPIALDGIIQTVSTFFGFGGASEFYTSSNFTRALTGSLFGLGMGLIILPLLYDLYLDKKVSEERSKYVRIIFIVLPVMMLFYVIMVQVWDITSTEYKPDNFLDLAVRTPATEERWIRQTHGACTPEDPKTISGGLGGFAFSLEDCF
jgi:uncharacterized membrane protein